MNKASTFDEWIDAMKMMSIPMFNAGYGDKFGNIYYIYNASLPMRNENYNWAPSILNHRGPAYLETITYRFIPEKSTRLIAFENSEFDIMDGLPSEDYQRIKDDKNFRLKFFVVPGLPQVMNINVTSGPTKELAVRQAMLYAIDEDMMVNLIFFGANPAAKGPLSSGSWAYWDGVEKMYPYNPEKAKSLLDKAGWKDTNGDGIREKNFRRFPWRRSQANLLARS